MSASHEMNFELPRNIERYLAALSRLYAKENKKQMQEICVNSQVRVHEAWDYNNWNGGIYGHALYLALPETLYLGLIKQKDELQNQIKEDINKVHSYQSEYICNVVLEMEVVEAQDWRKESGLLVGGKRVILPDAASRIWKNEGYYRVFLSHKAEFKKEAAELKDRLLLYGISPFVAHEDIHPTREWQNEVENALFSMDALVALMTEGFHDSFWTDQEVGVAFGRGVPIISIKLGKDPYGFIGKFQALSCPWDSTAKEIVKVSIKQEQMLDAYIKAVQNCPDYDCGVKLSEVLPFINKLSEQQANDIVSAFNNNSQVRDCYGFNGKKPYRYGDGLVTHLKRLIGRNYRLSHLGEIEIAG